MIQISPHCPIFIHTGFVDFRKGIDGLCGVCKYEMDKDPLNGALFVFSNRSRQSLKILIYDGQGFWVFHKRLSTGKFNWWPTSSKIYSELISRELSVLIWNGDPNETKMQKDWRAIDKISDLPIA